MICALFQNTGTPGPTPVPIYFPTISAGTPGPTAAPTPAPITAGTPGPTPSPISFPTISAGTPGPTAAPTPAPTSDQDSGSELLNQLIHFQCPAVLLVEVQKSVYKESFGRHR
jgi:hypothetical protein